MILPDFNDFPRSGPLLGIDWGACRTGVAVSDKSLDFVFTRPAIVYKKGGESIAKKISDIAISEKAVGIVMGLPLFLDGQESETTDSVRLCAREMCTYTDLPIVFIDEVLTSHTAQEEMGRVRVSDIKKNLDSESARVILENAIAIIKRLKK